MPAARTTGGLRRVRRRRSARWYCWIDDGKLRTARVRLAVDHLERPVEAQPDARGDSCRSRSGRSGSPALAVGSAVAEVGRHLADPDAVADAADRRWACTDTSSPRSACRPARRHPVGSPLVASAIVAGGAGLMGSGGIGERAPRCCHRSASSCRPRSPCCVPLVVPLNVVTSTSSTADIGRRVDGHRPADHQQGAAWSPAPRARLELRRPSAPSVVRSIEPARNSVAGRLEEACAIASAQLAISRSPPISWGVSEAGSRAGVAAPAAGLGHLVEGAGQGQLVGRCADRWRHRERGRRSTRSRRPRRRADRSSARPPGRGSRGRMSRPTPGRQSQVVSVATNRPWRMS